MIKSEILAKIRHIELRTRRLLHGMNIGDHRTATKGSGFEFDQIRDYQEGDDVRFIDWQSSARMNKLLVRQYLEERNRTVILVVDGSQSTYYGSGQTFKSKVVSEVAAILSLVADYGKDSVGLVLYTDEIEYAIKPSRGHQHIHHLMTKLFEYQGKHAKTSLSKALDYLMQSEYKNALVVFISDFIDEDNEKKLSLISQRFECIAIRCLDAVEQQFPATGFIMVQDPESGDMVTIDARELSQKKINKILEQRKQDQTMLFKKYGIALIDVTPGHDAIAAMVRFFRQRVID